MDIKITVIIPVYNTKDYLKESIDSILEQKEFVHELLLINDGSTDGSGELLEKLYAGYDFVKIFHTKNQRQGPARNLGTEQSTGDYIYYFDSDDIVKPGLFKRFAKLIAENKDLEIFCFSAEPFIDEDYNVDETVENQILKTKAYSRKINKLCQTGEEAFNLLFPIKSFSPLPYLYLFKKSILINNNIKFRSIRFEDEEFVYQLFLAAGKTIISDENFVGRRIREGSTMELDRCFADILGYVETIKTLERLLLNRHFREETKKNLTIKVKVLNEAIIKMKVRSSLKLSQEEKIVYKNSLKKYIFNDKDLFLLYFTYHIEFKLRMLKKKIFG